MNSLRAGMLSCARNPDNVRMRMIARSSLTLETRKLEYADERKGQRCVKAGDGGSNSYIYILVSMHRPRGGHLGFPPQLRAARTPRTVHAGESRLRSPRPGSPSVTPAEFGFARHTSRGYLISLPGFREGKSPERCHFSLWGQWDIRLSF